MKILCLMPTYGRRAALLENSIQLFLNQDYPDADLLIYDDLGTLAETSGNIDKTMVLSTKVRANSLGGKYNTMMEFAINRYDAVVVWDDDDTYTPHHISTHVAILKDHPWSKPSTIVSSYHSPPREEGAKGRFHGSIAIRVDFLQRIQQQTSCMWIDTRRATFDQEMLGKLSDYSPPGDPYTIAPPSYVYRWADTNSGHCSGLMGNPDWYIKYQPDSTLPIPFLIPKLDDATNRILQQLSSSNQ